MAADEMKQRLGDICEGSFIGTVHGYGAHICLSNGVFVMDEIQDENYDIILEKAIEIPTSKYPRIQHLLVDEAQDLTRLEYDFIKKIQTDYSFFVGDDRQNIYQFRGGSDKFLRDMINDAGFKVYYLTQNYRNAPNILSFADEMLQPYNSLSLSCEPTKTLEGELEHCPFETALTYLEADQNWGNWFILARTNRDLLEVKGRLDEKEIPNITFKRGDMDTLNDLENLMKTNTVKILTIHAAKGLEANNVIVVGAKGYNDEERRLRYVASTRARNNLYWCPAICKNKRGQSEDAKSELNVAANDRARTQKYAMRGMIEF